MIDLKAMTAILLSLAMLTNTAQAKAYTFSYHWENGKKTEEKKETGKKGFNKKNTKKEDRDESSRESEESSDGENNEPIVLDLSLPVVLVIASVYFIGSFFIDYEKYDFEALFNEFFEKWKEHYESSQQESSLQGNKLKACLDLFAAVSYTHLTLPTNREV